ncbi:MAG: hypothetical protein JSW58_16970 [Candidatus Latescibacterota bacterium]|nr:MAG: hypothetical protein JSW58_16970 [Candidatus Latescibacterota bacterium]
MRAFFYTLILTVLLVVAVVFLYSLPQREAARRAGPRSTMTVKSEPASLPKIDRSNLDESNRDALFETGVELLDLWHVPEAVGVFETVVDLDSNHVAAYAKLAECHSHSIVGQEEHAKKSLQRAMTAASQTGGDTLRVSAIGHLFVDRSYEEAIDKLIRCMEKSGEDDELAFLLGLAHLGLDQVDEAERYLGALLERDPSLGRAKELFIRCKVAKGEFDQAEAVARDLAAVYPEEPYPYVLLSQVLLLRDKVDEAVEFGNNALRLDEKFIPAIVSRAHLYVAEGEEGAARVSFEKLLLFDEPAIRAVGADGIAYVGFLTGRFDQATSDMDEAIRLAMNVGSTRRGLVYAFRLVDYLCELGRSDAAAAVLDRWVTQFGEIPYRLGQLRILISEGDLSTVRHGLRRIHGVEEWHRWMRHIELDFTDLQALTLIKEENFAEAIELLSGAGRSSISGGRRDYLKGYASFERGAAEQAADLFNRARARLHSLEFPYHSDPVLYVQSIFFLGEAAIARGEAEDAAGYYTEFLELWGDADWDLRAVDRASRRLGTLRGES